MTPRARPMAPDDRRQAIVEVVIPLLVERGSEVTTKEIAQAARIAEGTIFRVFPDKRSLFLAAAEEAMNPADGEEAFDAALAGVTDLREGVVVVTERVLERMRLTMSVMMAVRPQLIAAFHEEKAAGRKHEIGPPPFVLKAQADLHRRLTRLFEPHADRLAVDPGTAAIALRSLIFGAHRPELGMTPSLTPDQIADLLLGGVLARKED